MPIPDCPDGQWRSPYAAPDPVTGLIPCIDLPLCSEGEYRPTPNADCEAIPDCAEQEYRPPGGE